MKINKAKRNRLLAWLAVVLGFVLLVFAGYMLVTQLIDYSKSNELYDNTNDVYVASIVDDVNDETQQVADWTDLADVELSQLIEVNEDIAGWIFFENIDISYPVLYSGDNSKYLRRTYTGENLMSGSIFIEGANNRDFSDSHTIIYGHNMNDHSMFGKLEYFVTEPEYITEHEYFQIITENEKYRYKIISYKIVGGDSEVYTVFKTGNQNFVNFVNEKILDGSFINIDSDIEQSDHVITLSTCFNDNRLVVSAIRVDESTIK